MNRTKIDYVAVSWNPIAMRCAPVSEGCNHCWHLSMCKRHAANPNLSEEIRSARGGGDPILLTKVLDAPLRWKKPVTVATQFMGDLFCDDVPLEFIDQVFATVARCPEHQFMILTKRSDRMAAYFEDVRFEVVDKATGQTVRHFFKSRKYAIEPYTGTEICRWPLENLWLGVTAENQARADERIPILLQTPAAHHWVSAEPLLGEIDMGPYLPFPTKDAEGNSIKGVGYVGNNVVLDYKDKQLYSDVDWYFRKGLDLVVCGGETGPGARPMNPAWVRSIRDQCAATDVDFFFKGWGDWAPDCTCGLHYSHKAIERPSPGRIGVMFRCGKKRAGRLLDGREHNGEVEK